MNTPSVAEHSEIGKDRRGGRAGGRMPPTGRVAGGPSSAQVCPALHNLATVLFSGYRNTSRVGLLAQGSDDSPISTLAVPSALPATTRGFLSADDIFRVDGTATTLSAARNQMYHPRPTEDTSELGNPVQSSPVRPVRPVRPNSTRLALISPAKTLCGLYNRHVEYRYQG